MTQPTLNDNEIAKLYLQASQDMPSLVLDATILAAAHKAVSSKPAPVKPKPSLLQRWQLPMGIAATVVISASLTSIMMRERPDIISPTTINSTIVSPTIVRPTTETATTATPASSSMPLPASKPSSMRPPTSAQATIEVSPAVTATVLAANKPSGALTDNKQQKSSLSKQAKITQTAKPVADDLARRAQELASAPATEAQVPQSATVAASTVENKSSEEVAMPAPVPVPTPSPAPAGLGKNSTADKAKSGAVKKQRSATELAPDEEPQPEISPEAWLKKIEDLRNKGELNLAQQSLKAFKLRYPDYALPKALIEFSE